MLRNIIKNLKNKKLALESSSVQIDIRREDLKQKNIDLEAQIVRQKDELMEKATKLQQYELEIQQLKIQNEKQGKMEETIPSKK